MEATRIKGPAGHSETLNQLDRRHYDLLTISTKNRPGNPGRFFLQSIRHRFSSPFKKGDYKVYARGRTLVFTQETMSSVEVPGVKISLMPAAFRPGMSSSGMTPPPKTLMSSAFFSLKS